MYAKLVAALASNRFFYAILAIFVLSAVWIAVSGRYPMAFDEDFHLGIIRLYAEQWTPFFSAQPANADQFGAVVRDPSYLHHYLLSFPYRLTDRMFGSDFINVMVLRGFGIAFMAAGLLIFRRVLRYTRASDALVNLVLLLVVLTPVVPFLGAQINYDNMLFPVVGAILWLTLRFTRRLQTGHLDTPALIGLACACMVASLIKYAFLPIFFGVVVYIGLELKRAIDRKGITFRQLWRNAIREVKASSRRLRVSLAAGLVVCSGLFVAMYGYNLVAYHAPIPECDQVLGVERCNAYGAWARNYKYAQTKTYVNPDPFKFTYEWAGTYIESAFFAVNGIYSGFIIGQAYPVLHTAAKVGVVVIVPLVLWHRRALWRRSAVRLFIIVCAIYGTALWVQNYGEFINLGTHVAEHGRYWVVLLPALYMVLALAVARSFNGNKKLLTGGIILVLLAFSQGGGMLTYATRSDADWWWRDNPVAPALNESAQRLSRPLLYGSDMPNIKPWEIGR